MGQVLSKWIAGWLPPRLMALCNRLRGSGGGYRGDFASWDEARRQCRGYDDAAILQRVRDSARKVRDGQAAFERDGVAFTEPEHRFPLLTGLLRAAASAGGRLHVLDFGGSLGSSYFQCRPLLQDVTDLRWSIVEQPHFVELGRAEFQTDQLRFYPDVQACIAQERPNALLLSSVLPYVPDPYGLLDELLPLNIPHLIIDRTPTLIDRPDRLTVQHVPASIYGRPVSYPAWIVSRGKLLAMLTETYKPVAEFEALAGRIDLGDAVATDAGLMLDRRGQQ